MNGRNRLLYRIKKEIIYLKTQSRKNHENHAPKEYATEPLPSCPPSLLRPSPHPSCHSRQVQAGIHPIVPSPGRERMLDSRLKMSGMTEREMSGMTERGCRPFCPARRLLPFCPPSLLSFPKVLLLSCPQVLLLSFPPGFSGNPSCCPLFFLSRRPGFGTDWMPDTACPRRLK